MEPLAPKRADAAEEQEPSLVAALPAAASLLAFLLGVEPLGATQPAESWTEQAVG